MITSCYAAQKKSRVTSLLYNSEGQLIVDTSFRITKNQLYKFSRIENKFTKQILDSLKASKIIYENGVMYEVIVSFTVDEHSYFSYLHIEKFVNFGISTLEAKAVKTDSKYMFMDAILNSSCKFMKEGFKADKKKCEKYFLPIKFHEDSSLRIIKNGWLLYQIVPVLIEHRVNQKKDN